MIACKHVLCNDKARNQIFIIIWAETVRILRLKRPNQTDELDHLKSLTKTYLRDTTSNWEFPLGIDKGRN